MRKVAILIGGVALNLLLNATAGLLGRDDAIRLTRGGWLILALYATFILLTETRIRQAVDRLRLKFWSRKVLSYFVVAVLGAILSLTYWAVINGVYSRMFRAKNQTDSAQAVQPASTTSAESGKSAPDLRGQIEQAMFGTPSDKSEDTAITLVVSIRNAGAPSIAEMWDFIVDIPNAGRFSTFMPYFDGELKLPLANRPDKTVVYHSDDLLLKKAAKPIPTGDEVRGILLFIVKGVKRDVVYQKGTKMELSFSDVTGKRYTISQDVRVGPNNLLSVGPGMDTQLRVEPKLTAKMEVVSVGEWREMNAVAFTMIVSVRNTGEPTIVDGWDFTFESPNKGNFKGLFKPLPNEVILNVADQPSLYIKRKDALYLKTAEKPIPAGGKVRGVLIFLMYGAEYETFFNPEGKLILSFKDVHGTRYTATRGVSEDVPFPASLPGVDIRVGKERKRVIARKP